MRILGLNAYHADASSALVVDGRVVAAAEEERFRRAKHWAGLPSKSAGWCLSSAGLGLADVDVIAINRQPRANAWRKARHALVHGTATSLLRDRLSNRRRVLSVPDLLEQELSGAFRGRFVRVEHHLAHLASSFLASPYREAAVVSVDGFGDFCSSAWGIGRGTQIRIEGQVFFPHSLGAFYLALTQYLGFLNYGDEYKVMGLAAYGVPRFKKELSQVLKPDVDGRFKLGLQFFRHHIEDLAYSWQGGAPTVGVHYTSELEGLLGPARRSGEEITSHHRDVACSVQACLEDRLFDLLRRVQEDSGMEALALSGGVAMNSVANGKIRHQTAFKRLYVPPAPGDAGGALGAALAVWHRGGNRGKDAPRNNYHGSAYGAEEISDVLHAAAPDIAKVGGVVSLVPDAETLCGVVAEEIANGAVVGWFQGHMEFGPRALGNRSILANPARANMRDVINARIKRRESFRPFAPSILREHVTEWFTADDESPHMMKVLEIRPDKRHLIPAVTHVDGTGRLHTVTKEANALYYRLIECLAERTGVPMVLNTSFNENEPIVRTPEEALACFLRTDMDLLVLGQQMVSKTRPSA
ncbi:MAG: carbamoyltransferase family protein [Longimicrobiales bacterium]